MKDDLVPGRGVQTFRYAMRRLSENNLDFKPETDTIMLSPDLYEALVEDCFKYYPYSKEKTLTHYLGYSIKEDVTLQRGCWKVDPEHRMAREAQRLLERQEAIAQQEWHDHPDRWWNHSQARRDANEAALRLLTGK